MNRNILLCIISFLGFLALEMTGIFVVADLKFKSMFIIYGICELFFGFLYLRNYLKQK